MNNGLPLAEAVAAFGDIARTRYRYEDHLVRNIRSTGEAVTRENYPWLDRYLIDRVEGERRVAEKLAAGDLIATGFVRGAAPDAPPTPIAKERWCLLTLDFDASSATGAGITIDGIRVFAPGDRAKATKSEAVVQYIVSNRPDLKQIPSQAKRAKRIATIVGCSEELARQILRREGL